MIKRNKNHGDITHWASTLILAGVLAFVVAIFSAQAETPTTPTDEEAQSIQHTLVMKTFENEQAAQEANAKADLALEKINELYELFLKEHK